jgi:hypothetical protein
VPGGRVAITDAQLREGWPRRIFSGSSVRMSSRTLLGRPDTDPPRDLAALAGSVEVKRIRLGPLGFDYLICSAAKP